MNTPARLNELATRHAYSSPKPFTTSDVHRYVVVSDWSKNAIETSHLVDVFCSLFAQTRLIHQLIKKSTLHRGHM